MERRAVIIALLTVVVATADAQKNKCKKELCPHFGMLRYYEDIGCIPSNNSSECCPTSYDCSLLINLRKSQCQYKGVVYEKGMVLEDELEDNCIEKCTCRDSPRGAFFHCKPVDCPEVFAFPQLENGCILKYRADECCATGIYCDGGVANVHVHSKPTVKCIYKGVPIVEGQYFSMSATACLSCTCQEGFDGTLNGPWCSKYSCDETLKRKNSDIIRCAPIFKEGNRCCPYGSHCPSASDSVIRAQNTSTTENEAYCTYGELKLQIGDQLATNSDCFKCSCDVPPFLTCFLECRING